MDGTTGLRGAGSTMGEEVQHGLDDSDDHHYALFRSFVHSCMMKLKPTIFVGVFVLVAVKLEWLVLWWWETWPLFELGVVTPMQSKHNIDFALFYNAFVPLGEDNNDRENIRANPKLHSLEIIQDHLTQIGALFEQVQRAGRTRQVLLPVRYITIGDPETTFFVREVCKSLPLVCTHQGHHETGFEEVTLQVAHEYCIDNPLSRIIYVHNKGSLHPDVRNGISQDAWRQRATAGAMHPDCLFPPNPQCNLCGLYVEVVPTIHQP
jgi:hypothetical protein